MWPAWSGSSGTLSSNEGKLVTANECLQLSEEWVTANERAEVRDQGMYNIQGPENLEVIIAFLKVIKEKKQEMLNKEEILTAHGGGMK